MNGVNKLLIIIALVGFAAGCAEDVVLPPLPSLCGKYEGTYTVDETGLDGGTKHTVKVAWIFSTNRYFMKLDSVATNSGFCQPSGEYVLGDGVDLQEGSMLNGCTGSIAQESWNPSGLFRLEQPEDSIILKQSTTLEEGNVIKTLKLARLDDCLD